MPSSFLSSLQILSPLIIITALVDGYSVSLSCTMKKINLKGGEVYFCLWFQKLQFMVTWLCCLWACGERAHGKRNCSPHGGRKTKREKGGNANISSKDTPPMAQHLPIRSYLLWVLLPPHITIDWQPCLQPVGF